MCPQGSAPSPKIFRKCCFTTQGPAPGAAAAAAASTTAGRTLQVMQAATVVMRAAERPKNRRPRSKADFHPELHCGVREAEKEIGAMKKI